MSNLYCAAPWRGLHINTEGDVKPCCSGEHGFGNINDIDLPDIVNSVKWQQLRQDIAHGIKPRYCKICNSQGDSSLNERHWHNVTSPDIQNTSIDYHSPAILDVRWSNACNLMCVYCNPYDSSMWARKLNFPLRTKRKEYYSNVINYIQTHQQDLKTVALIGGEPLLIPQCSELLDAIDDTVEIHIITNLSLDLTNNPTFQRLSERHNVRWSVSFENVGQQFEYVRRGANWNQLKINLVKLKELEQTRGHGIDIHAVLNILSLSTFDQLVAFGQEQKLKIVCQFLDEPTELDLRSFPDPVLERTKASIEAVCANTSAEWVDIETIKQYFLQKKSKSSDQLENFYRFTQQHDTEQLQFASLWPELDKQLKECYNSSIVRN